MNHHDTLRRSGTLLASLLCLALMLAATGCAKKVIYPDRSRPGVSQPQAGRTPAGATKRGTKPYEIKGETYHPLASAHGFSEEGLASWYGKEFHGRPTANGETYDMYGMTAAHKLLPFNTMIRVTNLENGKSTVVRVNDRGPFIRDRVIDLTYTAGEKIGLIGPGTARVRLEAVNEIPGYTAGGDLPGSFYVQVGSFTMQENAHSLQERLAEMGFAQSRLQLAQVGGTNFWRVQVGAFDGLAAAREGQAALEKEFPSSFVIAD